MKGKANVIEALQEACAAEIRSETQYRQDAAVMDNFGLPVLAKYLLGRATEEHEHFQRYMERLVFLEGAPSFQSTATEYSGDISGVLRGQLALELQASADYQAWGDAAAAVGDAVSRDLFADIESDEQEHVNWLEGEVNILTRVGVDAYVAGYRAKEG
jgi:bacterioferritin